MKIVTQPLDPAIIARDLPAFEAAFEQLTADVMMIQAQLANKNMEVDGERVDDHTFHHWRRRAVYALSSKIVAKRALKVALHQARLLNVGTGSTPWSGEPGNGGGDLRTFSLNTASAIADVLRRIGTLEATIPAHEDFTDLIECARESLTELQAYVSGIANAVEEVAS